MDKRIKKNKLKKGDYDPEAEKAKIKEILVKYKTDFLREKYKKQKAKSKTMKKIIKTTIKTIKLFS